MGGWGRGKVLKHYETEHRIDAELSVDSLQECRIMQVGHAQHQHLSWQHTLTSFIILSSKGRLPASGMGAERPGLACLDDLQLLQRPDVGRFVRGHQHLIIMRMIAIQRGMFMLESSSAVNIYYD
jgi:hypothetical protein